MDATEQCPYCGRYDLRERVKLLREALGEIVAAWRAVDPNEQVPESINVDELWERADAALRASGPDLFAAIAATKEQP